MPTNNWYVITGGPSSGKTTLLAELEKLGHKIIPEAARAVIDEGIAKGLSVQAIRADEKQFQKEVLRRKVSVEAEHEPQLVTFFDRGLHDTIAYLKLYSYKIDSWIHEEVKKAQYNKIFLLDQLPEHFLDYARTESPEILNKLNRLLYEAYSEAGLKPIHVPVLPPQDRAQFVLDTIEPGSTST